MSATIERLRAAVRESGTPLAASLGDGPCGVDGDERALVAAHGPRVAAAHRQDVEVAVAAVQEGYRLHYGVGSRALRIDDADFALLAGDRMYALGLARLAAIGDLTAIAELADVIALCAQAQAANDDELADAAWQSGAEAIACGRTPDHAEAKARARAGAPGAAGRLRASAQASGERLSGPAQTPQVRAYGRAPSGPPRSSGR